MLKTVKQFGSVPNCEDFTKPSPLPKCGFHICEVNGMVFEGLAALKFLPGDQVNLQAP